MENDKISALLMNIISSYHKIMIRYGERYPVPDMTKNQKRILMTLLTSGPMSLSCLGQSMELPKGSMTAIVDSLEAAGLAARRLRKDDRRIIEVVLTEKGEVWARDRREKVEEYLTHLLEGIPDLDKDSLLKRMNDTAGLLDRLAAEALCRK